MKKYLFSNKNNDGSDIHFYFRQISSEEMNESIQIKQMIANVSYRATENYKKIEPNYNNQAREYKIEDEDLPKVRDSNINPKEICGFLIEDQVENPVSIILAGISKDPLRIMMGTIATAKEHEGKGYFSILFDETITKIAKDNNNELPKVLISLRGVTSKGANFDTYLAILKSRNFDISAIEREIKSLNEIDPNIGYIPHDLTKIITNIDKTKNLKQESQNLKNEIEKKPFQAFFFLGSPQNITLQDFIKNQENRINEKVAKNQIFINSNSLANNKSLSSSKNIEFKDPQAINNAVLVSQNIEDLKLGEKNILKSFTQYVGIAISYGIADVKYNNENKQYEINYFVNNQEENNQKSLLFSIDSNTKMVTAVAILRMLEEGIYKKYFPQGIDTKLSYFAEVLSEKFPNSKYFKEELVKDPNYQNITIKNLAQHTSGLIQVDKNSSSFNKKIVKNHQKLSLDEMIDLEKIERDNSWGQKQGQYLYNNIDYEILGRILIAVASKENNNDIKYGDIINELVVAGVKEKIIANDKVNGKEIAENLKYFTSDQILYIDNKSKIDNKFDKQQDLTIAETKNFYDGKLIKIPSHFYDLACGGSYADPVSQALIAMHILANNDNFSIFKDENIQKIFNEQKIEQYDGKNENSKAKTYGFGYMAFSDLAWKDYRTHNGGGFGSNSSTIIDLKNNRAIFSVVHFEDLTMPIAYAINKGQLLEAKWQEDKKTIKLNDDIYRASLELQQNFTEEEILAMRNALEKSNEEFWKFYNSLAKPQKNNEIIPNNNLQNFKIDEKLAKITTNDNQQS